MTRKSRSKKDFYFDFKPRDFLSETMFLSMEERGQYITILCAMHQHGGMLKSESIRFLVGSCSVSVKKLLSYDKKTDSYFSEDLILEMERRLKYCESRRLNGSKGGRPVFQKPELNVKTVNHMDSICKPYENHTKAKAKYKAKSKAKEIGVVGEREEKIDKVIDNLNEITDSDYKKTTQHTRTLVDRLFNDGYTESEIEMVFILKKYESETMNGGGRPIFDPKYLRPKTLLIKSNFEGYLRAAKKLKSGQIKRQQNSNLEQHKKVAKEFDRLGI